ncbi:hypothetical protein EDD11_005711 [Mortierella claussenii]|nr:hypothetical protein EDD11_005711 [Mortierella claussenii]
MPTYSPVPASFTSLSHRGQALFLYRHILREGIRFFDERTSHWVMTRTQEVFRKNRHQTDQNRIEKAMSDARKALRLLERANQVDQKAVMRLLRLTYGLQGKERHRLLQPYVDSMRFHTTSPDKLSAAIMAATPSTPASSSQSATPPSTKQLATALSRSIKGPPQPLFYNNARTVPPILAPILTTLIKSATGKSEKPQLPQPLFKPLHGKREANLRWRHLSKQFKKVNPPLPSVLLQEIEWKSRIGLNKQVQQEGIREDNHSATELDRAEWEHHIFQTIQTWNKRGQRERERRWETGRVSPSIGGRPGWAITLTPRLYRRIWQRLLDSVPVLDMRMSNSTSSKSAVTMLDEASDAVQPVLRPSFAVSKSPMSSGARSGPGLKMLSTLNSFDKLGLTGNKESWKSTKKGRNKEGASKS